MTFDEALQQLSTFCHHHQTCALSASHSNTCTCGLVATLGAIKDGLMAERQELLEVAVEATALVANVERALHGFNSETAHKWIEILQKHRDN